MTNPHTFDYEQFLALEREKYGNGPVTEEEGLSFERELELLRAFRIGQHTGPILPFKAGGSVC